MFERIVSAAADSRIFDLIKVDYIVSDFDSVRTGLFDAAATVLKGKEQKYATALGMSPSPVGLSIEQYNVTYPTEAYQALPGIRDWRRICPQSPGRLKPRGPTQEFHVLLRAV